MAAPSKSMGQAWQPHKNGTIMNVTPQEYSQIKEAALSSVGQFEWYVSHYFGCEPYVKYSVFVRYDVPSVPWYSKDCERFSIPQNEDLNEAASSEKLAREKETSDAT